MRLLRGATSLNAPCRRPRPVGAMPLLRVPVAHAHTSTGLQHERRAGFADIHSCFNSLLPISFPGFGSISLFTFHSSLLALAPSPTRRNVRQPAATSVWERAGGEGRQRRWLCTCFNRTSHCHTQHRHAATAACDDDVAICFELLFLTSISVRRKLAMIRYFISNSWPLLAPPVRTISIWMRRCAARSAPSRLSPPPM